MENTVYVHARQKIILEVRYPFNSGSFVLDLEPSIHVKKVLSHDTVPSADLESIAFPQHLFFQCFGSVFIGCGQGSGSGYRVLITKNLKKFTTEKKLNFY
jgi:hypothetical protein